MRSRFRVKIIGAGVIGLSTACVLAKAHYRVCLVADCHPKDTTSVVAAAFWEPFHVDGIDLNWAKYSYKYFRSLCSKEAEHIIFNFLIRYDRETTIQCCALWIDRELRYRGPLLIPRPCRIDGLIVETVCRIVGHCLRLIGQKAECEETTYDDECVTHSYLPRRVSDPRSVVKPYELVEALKANPQINARYRL